MKRLFVVANRLPISIESVAGEHIVRSSSGGLVSAVDSYLSGKGRGEFDATFWVGIAGCSEAVWSRLHHEELGHYEMLPVFPDRKAYDAYYNGFSNSCLWPLFHYFPSITDYSLSHFRSYIQINQLFADRLAGQCRAGDVIWIHDYHLMLLPDMLRQLVPGITIGFFLHIPFPSFEIFRLMPRRWQTRLLEGMMGADLLGFHTMDYVRYFLDSIRLVLKPEPEGNMIDHQGRSVKAEVFPIGIDFNKFYDAWDDPEVASRRAALKEQFDGRKLIFSVDRLDYTKGVWHRLRGYEHFLLQHPEYHGKVVFLLVLVPSRDTISRYAERKKLIDEFIGNLNSRLSTMFWQPVIYQYSHLSFEELLALYTACDMALITPLRDGMNLVAKEFVASRKDGRGVLVLSEMTGAARELQDALLINPNDTEEIADCILQGLEMDPAEQGQRLQIMQERVRRYNVSAWAEDFFRQLHEVKLNQPEPANKFLDEEAKAQLLASYRRASKRLLLLDYDGTLAPFTPQPSRAIPQQSLLGLLARLLEDPANDMYIISGRDSGTLDRWLGHLPVNLIAEHGSKLRLVRQQWATEGAGDALWRDEVEAIMTAYVGGCPHSFIERKDFSIAWHYRSAEPQQGLLKSRELIRELESAFKDKNLGVMDGNKVVEVRVKGISKGTAVARLVSQGDYDFVLAVGDDVTDEDMFRELESNERAFTIKVGSDKSVARYNVHTPAMVHALLDMLGKAEK